MVLIESQAALVPGDRAPGFSLRGADGRTHSLADYDGREGLLVIFMCNHCPYVKAKIDAIKGLHERFGDRVAVVGINSNDQEKYPEDSFEAMQEACRERGLEFDYLSDDTQEVARSYGATCTPDPFLFDGQGRLVFHGRLDDAMTPDEEATEETMAANIEAMLAGRPIAKQFDPSIGCSIKWKET